MPLTVDSSISLPPRSKANDDRRRSSRDTESEGFQQALEARADLCFDSPAPVAVAPGTGAALADLEHIDGAALPAVVRLYEDED